MQNNLPLPTSHVKGLLCAVGQSQGTCLSSGSSQASSAPLRSGVAGQDGGDIWTPLGLTELGRCLWRMVPMPKVGAVGSISESRGGSGDLCRTWQHV